MLYQLSYIPRIDQRRIVRVLGFEPRTSALSELRSSQLSYTRASQINSATPGGTPRPIRGSWNYKKDGMAVNCPAEFGRIPSSAGRIIRLVHTLDPRLRAIMSDAKPLRSPGARFREAYSKEILALPGVFCPLVARMAEGIGFRAVYLSGGALSAGHGVPDIGLLTSNDFAAAAVAIASATSLPLLCDADTGFGEALNVERTVRQFEQAGAAGLHLEDQQMPKRCGHLSGKSLVDAHDMAAKIRAAVAAKRDPDFVIVARTDARGVTGYDDAVRRARIYLEAGADVIFPEALEDSEEFANFARDVPAPLMANMTEFGKGPLLDTASLAALGYRIALFPLTAFRTAMKAAYQTLAELHALGTQKPSLSRMMTRAELYDLLGYSGYETRDRSYFGGKSESP